jgi:hypothetical protein
MLFFMKLSCRFVMQIVAEGARRMVEALRRVASKRYGIRRGAAHREQILTSVASAALGHAADAAA